jgi:peptidyl-prolyl cis-trans isomerase
MGNNNDKNLDRLSYALGLSMGNNFRASGIDTINVGDFADGVAAVFDGAPLKMSYEEAKAEIQVYFTELEKKQQKAAAELGEQNKALGEKFLMENGKRVEVLTTPSGLQYEVLKEGDGPKPTAADRVEVHYTGKLIDGTVFDSSEERGVPATFGVTQVIPGWVEALQLMKAGSKWRLFIPSNLAYGPNGAPGSPIGPNATLIFDVELLKVLDK